MRAKIRLKMLQQLWKFRFRCNQSKKKVRVRLQRRSLERKMLTRVIIKRKVGREIRRAKNKRRPMSKYS